jgi:hypothetical protein
MLWFVQLAGRGKLQANGRIKISHDRMVALVQSDVTSGFGRRCRQR